MKVEAIRSASDYSPAAIYYDGADMMEYVREDIPSVARRVDEFLTLVVSLEDRHLIGVRLKGFKYLFNKKLISLEKSSLPNKNLDGEFMLLTKIFEELMTKIGNEIMAQVDRKRAYEQAMEIVEFDQVRFKTDQVAA
jgi:hypothetical protein